MRNGRVKGTDRMSPLVSKNIRAEGAFIPIHPSQNSLLALKTDILILISTSITSVSPAPRFDRVTILGQPRQLPGSPVLRQYFLLSKKRSWKDTHTVLEVKHRLCLATFLLLGPGPCCSPDNTSLTGRNNTALTAVSTLVADISGHHRCRYAWFWTFHQPGHWAMAAVPEMLQIVLCTWARAVGMRTCSGLTRPGTIVCSVSPLQVVGIVRACEALGLFVFFFLLKILIIIF